MVWFVLGSSIMSSTRQNNEEQRSKFSERTCGFHCENTPNGRVSTIGMCIIIITIVGDKIRGSVQPLWRVTSHDVVLLGTKLWTYQRQNVAYLLIKELLGKKWGKARHYCRHFTSIRACSLIFWPILKKCYEVLNAWNAAWHIFKIYLETRCTQDCSRAEYLKHYSTDKLSRFAPKKIPERPIGSVHGHDLHICAHWP